MTHCRPHHPLRRRPPSTARPPSPAPAPPSASTHTPRGHSAKVGGSGVGRTTVIDSHLQDEKYVLETSGLRTAKNKGLC